MLYTLFFSRLHDLGDAGTAEYQERVGALKALAEAEHPGFLGMKSYVAEDGERLTVVRFRDAESQRAWRLDPSHREAQVRGRTHYYERFHIVVCEERHAHEFTRASEEG
jgi:heme-degrading monooxygenase HmoA